MEKIYFEAKVKKSQTPIESVIKKLDIIYPNESLGFLHAIYAKADGKTPNLNKVILDTSVKQDVPQLRFLQANMNHQRAGFVMGTILDSWVNPKTEEIEIVFSFFKPQQEFRTFIDIYIHLYFTTHFFYNLINMVQS